MSKPLPSVIDGYVRDGLVLCFDGYQAPSGGKWKDLSGSGNDLVLADGVTYDAEAHKVTFATKLSTTANEVPMKPASGLTIEVVAPIKGTMTFFESATNWPNSPKVFMSNFFYVNLQTATSTTTYANSAGQRGNDVAGITGAAQFAIAGANSEMNTMLKSGGWWLSPSIAQTESFIDTNYRIQIYSTTSIALRIYNRKLTAAELLQNRLLDAKRFNLSTTNIQG